MQTLPIKVLIADDEANIRNLLSEGLSSRVEHVTEVSEGPEALAQLEKNDFDILLLDINMPDMNGIEVLKKLKLLDVSV